MAKSLFEIFNDKVSLIYEYDKSSPLFVRKANTEILKNNIDDAIDVLMKGIENYPDYPTAYFILGKAYALKNQFKDAEDSYKKGSDLIYSKSTFDFYMDEIENLKSERLVFNPERGNAFLKTENNIKEKEKEEPSLNINENVEIDNSDDVQETIEDLVKDAEDVEIEKVEKEFKKSIGIHGNFEEKLDELANEISSAKLPPIDNTPIDNVSTKEFLNEDPMIISETLAKIYEAQNEFKEAIKIYERLIIKHPDKKEEFTNRILSLKNRSEKTSD